MGYLTNLNVPTTQVEMEIQKEENSEGGETSNFMANWYNAVLIKPGVDSHNTQ